MCKSRLKGADGGWVFKTHGAVHGDGVKRCEGSSNDKPASAAPHPVVVNASPQGEDEDEPEYHKEDWSRDGKRYCDEDLWFKLGVAYTGILAGLSLVEIGSVVDFGAAGLIVFPGILIALTVFAALKC